MSETVPAWKFWHPLPFWHVIAIGFVTQIIATIPVIALRELAGLDLDGAIGGGLGGLLMFLVVRWLARRRLAAAGQASASA